MKKEKVNESGTTGWLAMIGKVLVFTMALSAVVQGLPWQNEAQAAPLSAKGVFAKRTSTGTQTITGLSFQPKAVIFFWTKQTADGYSAHRSQGYGFAAGSTIGNAAVVAQEGDNAGATASDANGYHSNASSIVLINAALNPAATASEAAVTAFTADGFTLNWTKSDAVADQIHYIALGGADLTNAQVGTTSLFTAVGANAVTGVGFQPDAVMLLGSNRSLALNTYAADGRVGITLGFMTPTTQGSTAFGARGGQTAFTGATYIDAATAYRNVRGNAADTVAAYSSMDANGFTLNCTATGGASNVAWLALKGGSYRVGAIAQRTSVGTTATTGLGFTPTGLILAGQNNTTANGTLDATQNKFSIGAASAAGVEGAIWGQNSAFNPNDANSSTISTKVIRHATNSATTNAEADLQSFDTDGFTLNWTTADATARRLIYFAVGAPPATNGSLAFTGATFSAAENGTTVNLTVSRTSGTTGAVSVECAYAGTGTATSGTDFTFASPATLNWAAGVGGNQNCTITLNDDTTWEGNETANFLLQNATGGATIGAQSTTALTITENDSVPTVQFSAATSNGSEGTTPAGPFTVLLSNATISNVTVTYNTANGTATAGSDYTAKTAQTLTIPALSTSGSITVAITDDVAVEAAETFTVTLSAPGNATLGATTVHTYTINDNEVANGTIALSAATYSVGEGGGFVTITATRTAGSASVVGITYATSNGSATAGSDYTAAGNTLSWADGDAADKTFTVSITEDTIYEGNQTFNVTLSAPTGGASLGGPSTAVVTITENDTPPTVAFQTASSSGSEATTPASFTVVLSGQTVSVVTINYATSNGTATAADFTAKSGTLTFPALSTTGTITVNIINDVVIDANENFTITLSGPANASLGAPATHTFTITDNDGTPPAVPTGVNVTNVKHNGALVSWNTVTGATQYNVYRSTDGVSWGAAIGGIATPPYTDTAAPKSNTKYYWTVTSFNGAESAYATAATTRTALYPGYNMISAPYATGGMVPVAAYGGWADWAWFWLSTSNVAPDTSGSWIWPNAATPGLGMLAWSYNDSTILTTGVTTTNPVSITVTLVPGWNIVSNQLLTDMTNIGTNWLVDGAPLTSKVADLTIGGALNWWNGSVYDSILISGNPAVEPWKSYFILNDTGVNHTLTIK